MATTPREQIATLADLPHDEVVRRLQVAETILSSLAVSSAKTCRKANEETPYPACLPYDEERCSPAWWRAKWEKEATAWLDNEGGE